MKTLFTTVAALLLGIQLSLAGNQLAQSSASTQPLVVGSTTPNITLNTADNIPTNLSQLSEPTIAIFYRGGWCPYCNRHLREIQGIKTKLIAMGYNIVGISPDKPEKLQTTIEGEKLDYQLLSDSKGKAALAFGIAFDAAKEYGPTHGDRINTLMAGFSGETHYQLPVPSVFILKQGKVVYSYSNPDHSSRLSADEMLRAAKAAL